MSENKKVWFGSDHHFGHEFMSKFRNFDTIEEHDQALIDAHNLVVQPGDDVYFMGDFVFRSARHYEHYTKQLNGNLHLIRGNHDSIGLTGGTRGFRWVKDYHEIKLPNLLSEEEIKPNIQVDLFHYPILCHNKNKRGAFMLHGHTHSAIDELTKGKIRDVEIKKSNLFEPYEWQDILLFMKDRPIYAPDCGIYC